MKAIELRGTASLDGLTECPETWLLRRSAAGIPGETWLGVPAIGRCTYSRYEASDIGSPVVSLGGTARNGRPLKPGPVSTRRHQGGYVKLDMRCDNLTHKRPHPLLMQEVVLTTFDKPRPPGMQGSHLSGNPQWNWIEWLKWETQPDNERRKENRPPPPAPTHPCRSAPACPNLVLHEGRFCKTCVEQVGRDIADMLRSNRPLQEAAERFGYKSLDWPYEIAVKFGGYDGSKAEAITQRPALTGWRKRAAQLLGVS